MSRNNIGRHSLWGCYGHYWVDARDAATHLTVRKPCPSLQQGIIGLQMSVVPRLRNSVPRREHPRRGGACTLKGTKVK